MGNLSQSTLTNNLPESSLVQKGHACSPEDCGGIPRYYGLLEAIDNPDDESHEEMCDWIDENLDPNTFSIDEVNRRLSPRPRPR